MRTVQAKEVTEKVAELCIKANLELRGDVLSALKKAYRQENKAQARRIIKAIIENARVACRLHLAICQDTGLAIVFAQVGQDVRVKGDLITAIQKGVEQGYKKGYLRNSIVKDPIARGVSRFGPAVVHIELVKGDRLHLTVLPKGFGSENKSALKMFNPTAEIEKIKEFIVDTVRQAGPDACPPYVVGVGIGGTADYASFLAKKALLRRIGFKASRDDLGRLEEELLKEINMLGIGPMGLGGKTTALAVNIETYPTHIAGMSVAVNISCHALRSASISL